MTAPDRRLSVVVPLRDEKDSLRELHRRLADVLPRCSESWEIVFVDDGSTDGSAELLRELAAEDPRVAVVRLRRGFGKTAALAAGFAHATGDLLATLDADLQDQPEELPRLLERLDAGADMVTGRKRVRRDPWSRRTASRLFNGLVSGLAGVELRDLNSGLKLMRREVARELPLHGELHRFLPVLAASRGYAVEEVDVAHEARRHGRSRYGWSRTLAGMLDAVTVLLLTRYGKRPAHFFGLFGLLAGLAGLAALSWLTVLWFLGYGIGQRPLLSLGVLLVLVGAQSVFFGLLAELVVMSSSGTAAGGTADPGYSVREVLGPRQGLGQG